MRRGVLGAGVVQVVGRDERDPDLGRDPEQVGAHPTLQAQTVVHDLAVVVFGADDVPHPARGLDGLVVLAQTQAGLHLTGGAPGRRDQTFGVFGDELVVHPRLVEEPFDARPRGEPEQVVHPDRRTGEEGQMRVGTTTGHVVAAAVAPLHAAPLRTMGPRREVGLGADDRPDAVGTGRLVELVGRMHVAVIGHRDRRHPQPGGLGAEIIDLRRTVEHGVLAVDVQVHELRAGHAGSLGRWPDRDDLRGPAAGCGACPGASRGGHARQPRPVAAGSPRQPRPWPPGHPGGSPWGPGRRTRSTLEPRELRAVTICNLA